MWGSLKIVLILGLVTLLSVTAWTYLWPTQDVTKVDKASAIICLGGGMSDDGTLHPPTIKRVETCVALYHAQRAPIIAFSGGRGIPNGPAAGEQMATLAKTMGVPAKAIVTESASQSTLQNALFTLPLLRQSNDLILVTEAFHLPRSWASFWWFGGRDMSLFASERIRRHSHSAAGWTMIPREAIAIWFNIGRASLWSTASLFGKQDDIWLY
ncbi:MAG: YdcF family protein [Cognatishimia sp.]|uniref:YdcF family protein n=1 Tax=Cognatishimia sp. TaxID=2211648 RepID=UPI003B8C0274